MLLRSHGGGNCSGDGGAHEGGPDFHPTDSKPLKESHYSFNKFERFKGSITTPQQVLAF